MTSSLCFVIISVMDEEKIQIVRRQNDEDATRKRASILGLQYLDAREIEQTLPLIHDLISIQEMHTNRIIPLIVNEEANTFRFAVTSTTPQSVLKNMTREYEASKIGRASCRERV